MKWFNWKKIVTCCYPIYLIAFIISLPIMAIIIFFESEMYKEAYYKTFKKYNKEFKRSK